MEKCKYYEPYVTECFNGHCPAADDELMIWLDKQYDCNECPYNTYRCEDCARYAVGRCPKGNNYVD